MSTKSRKNYDLDYKRRIVQEYLRNEITAKALADREGIERGQIYNWKTQLEERAKYARIEEIADTEGVSLDQARQIRELEEELEASQKKIAQLVLENDLLKKIQPSSVFARKSSGYIETKQLLARSKGRRK
ncbi:MAG: transposase [Candidatus Pacebacteria bacterium]|nr:transposase [Candidatus Paceibacterota bacterium]